MKFCLFLFKIFVCLLFTISVDCSVEYISLKKLCHYGDQTVPEAVQKKIYGILSPFFSQRLLIDYFDDRTVDTNFQALKYILMLTVPCNFPQDLFILILEKISPTLTTQALSFIRKYNSFNSQSRFIPFLHKNEVWSLQSESGYLFPGVGSRKNCIVLNVYKGFNDQTFPIAVLKIPPRQEFSGVNNSVLCLFETSCMSLVDLELKKETWYREYAKKSKGLLFGDWLGHLHIGYKNIICYASPPCYTSSGAVDLNEFKLKFYTFDQAGCNKNSTHTITNDKFWMMKDKKYIASSALNLSFFFYTFCQYGPCDGVFRELPERSFFKSGGQDFNRYLYYISYTSKDPEEKSLMTLDDVNNFFVCLSCNDTCLIARDNENKLYVFDIEKEPFTLKYTIQDTDKLLCKFWLDTDSDKILTQSGIFKIQDVFADLPDLNFVRSEEAKSATPLKPCKVKYGFLKGLRMRVFWFVRSWYWAIKKCLRQSISFILRRHS